MPTQSSYAGLDDSHIGVLVKERNIGAIGHETADTDAAIRAFQPDSHPLPAEQYILSQDRIQVEVLAHLDELPPVWSRYLCNFP